MKRHYLKSAHEYSNVPFSTRPVASRKRGFTLVELLVVVAIAAILSALLIGGFFNISTSNKRTSCQVNLQQIYGALKMYAADADGAYPYYNAFASADPATNKGGIPQAPPDASGNILHQQNVMGLWSLYTTKGAKDDVISPFDNTDGDMAATVVPQHDPNYVPRMYVTTDGTPAGPKKPLGVYLKNSGNLHCPSDIGRTMTDTNGDGTTDAPVPNTELYADANRTLFNPNYLSYQTFDNGSEIYKDSTLTTATYQSQRVTAPTSPFWRSQLMFWDGTQRVFDQRPASDTVITWCKWHRTGLGGRNVDPILFADGSVRSKPLNKQPDPSLDQQPGWQRPNN